MKPRSIKPGHILVGLLVAGSTLALVSWDSKQSPYRSQHPFAHADTTPQQKKTDKNIRDLDEALDRLDNIDLQLTLEKAMKEVNEAMKNVDMAKVRLDVEMAMKAVDLEKIKLDAEMAIKEVDFEKIRLDIDKAVKEVDFEKIKREIEQSVAKVDWEEIRKELEEAKNIDMGKLSADMKKAEEELKNIRPQIEKELAKAQAAINKAKLELKEYKELVDGLEKDGLINKKEPYSIKHDKGELTVNGKKVADQVYARYRSFLEKHKTFTIEKNEDDFDIDMD